MAEVVLYCGCLCGYQAGLPWCDTAPNAGAMGGEGGAHTSWNRAFTVFWVPGSSLLYVIRYLAVLMQSMFCW